MCWAGLNDWIADGQAYKLETNLCGLYMLHHTVLWGFGIELGI